jgi:hypothetical protein
MGGSRVASARQILHTDRAQRGNAGRRAAQAPRWIALRTKPRPVIQGLPQIINTRLTRPDRSGLLINRTPSAGLEWLANHQRSGALWKTAPIKANRRHPDGWESNSLCNLSNEVGVCTVTPSITAPPHELGCHGATFGRPFPLAMIFWKASNKCEVGHIGASGGHESHERQVQQYGHGDWVVVGREPSMSVAPVAASAAPASAEVRPDRRPAC